MQAISQQHILIETKKKSMSGSDYFAKNNLDFREWDVLCRTCILLERYNEFSPTFATQNLHPDFLAYNDRKEPIAPIEITEVIRPGYKRGAFWRTGDPEYYPGYDGVDSVTNPWDLLQIAISKKQTKNYAEGSWLIIYYDIGRMSFEDFETPFDIQLLAQHSKKPFVGVSIFEKVLVLSADMNSLVELYPSPHTIAPDTNK
ncbi:hypothetical protein NT6N_23590 [Oceaniferula spumae]|uniref:Restriction endonuclease domain-containing protein n=1 Tax=Oceaniferula spumae TaxID=2979115 RepID=A0AAT9FMY1_9BACT